MLSKESNQKQFKEKSFKEKFVQGTILCNKNKFTQLNEMVVPKEFFPIIDPFVNDVIKSFPEYSFLISQWWDDIVEENKIQSGTMHLQSLWTHCVSMFTTTYADILDENEALFSKENLTSTEFLPGISFKYIWNCDGVNDKTKTTIWKYLKMIVICLYSYVNSESFEASNAQLVKWKEIMNTDEIKEQIVNILSVYESESASASASASELDADTEPEEKPQLHSENPFAEILNGKLGDLAREIANESAQDFESSLFGDLDVSSVKDPQDMIQHLFKNPDKMMNIMKNVTSKLDSKLKTDEINQSDLMHEATNILGKINSLPGFENLNHMMQSMTGMNPMHRHQRPSNPASQPTNDVETRKRLKQLQMLERLRRKQEKVAVEQQDQLMRTPALSDEELINIFNSGSQTSAVKGAKAKVK